MYASDENDVQQTSAPKVSTADEKLLKEIRDRYAYAIEAWREIRDERKIDIRYICGDPWEPEDRKDRKERGKPCINHDELGQYINQAANNIRLNKRGIKIEPAGEGASEKTAEYRQNRIRAIEYKSKAQSAYATGYQAMLEGSYGFWRISRRYLPGGWDQEILIKNVPNPDSVVYDPDCKEGDWSDARFCFVVEPLSKDEFKQRYPNARRTDFTAEDVRIAKDWLSTENILVAEYWKLTSEPYTLYELETGEAVETLPAGATAKRQRTEYRKSICQYITNGVEILETNEQPGEEIPVIPCTGLERYVDEGAGPKRKLFSLVRLARDPQMSLAYLCSQEMEEAGLSPKTPYVGYTGQFETDKEAWDTVSKQAHPYVQADPITDSSNGQVLPLPRREPFIPNFAAYEMAKDSARRAIQAAMGITPLPTAMQRDSQKSGIALERVRDSAAQGSYHFQDNFDRSVSRTGRIIESYIAVVDDNEAIRPVRMPDDTHKLVRINTPEPVTDPETNETYHHVVEAAPHDTTASVGPSNESQREAAGEFLDNLIANLPKLAFLAPPQLAKLFALSVVMKQLGPKGDEMAEIIDPEQQQGEMPPEAQQAISQGQQQLQAINAYAQQLEGKVKELEAEKQAHVIDNQAKLQIAEFQRDTERLKIEADLAKAEISTKAQMLSEREALVQDVMKQVMAQFHEQQMQQTDQEHQHQMAEHQAQNQQDLVDQQAGNQSALQQQAAEQQPEAA